MTLLRPLQRINSIFALYARGGIQELLRARRNARLVNGILSGRTANLNDIKSFLLAHHVPVRAPLVLISQVDRSGGSLLCQLFDGHPDVAAHAHEITLSFPTEKHWVPLDPSLGANRNFRMLFESKIAARMRDGYSKGRQDPGVKRYPLVFVPHLQYSLFQHLFESAPPASPRASCWR